MNGMTYYIRFDFWKINEEAYKTIGRSEVASLLSELL